MNTEKKEHVVTEIFYPLGMEVPYLRRTGRPLQCDDPELQTCSDEIFGRWILHQLKPEDLSGFQRVVLGKILRGDLLITPSGEIHGWALSMVGEDIEKNDYFRVYRKLPVAENIHTNCFKEKEETSKVYRPLEPDEVIEEGDEYFSSFHPETWDEFNCFIGNTPKGINISTSNTRTTRPKPTQPAPNFDPKGDEGKKKPQLQLIPPVFNTELANALAFGAYHRKVPYEPWNWRKNKVEYMTYLGAMKRHIDALLEREDLASDSGVHHLGHIAASCAIVLDAAKHGTLVDNRPPAKLNSEPVVDNGAFNGVE